MKPETQNRRLEPTDLAKPGQTCGLTGRCPGLARQESAGRVFGWVSTQIDLFLRSKPKPLAGYADPLLTLVQAGRQDKACKSSLKTHRTFVGGKSVSLHHWHLACQRNKWWRVYGDIGMTELDWATGRLYLRDSGVDRCHLIILSYN